MADKLWNITIEGAVRDSTNEPGTVASELVGRLTQPGNKHASSGFTLFYDGIPAGVWPLFLKETWEQPFKKLVKLGLAQTGPTSFAGTSIPDGKTRKIYKVLMQGLKNASDFGDREGKKLGRSSEDDFDDDGREKRKKK